MKFFAPIIAIALSSTVSAAECYSNGGSNKCVSPSSIGNFRVQFCRDFWRAGDTTKTYVDDTNGKSTIFSKTGTFPDEAACLFSTGMFAKMTRRRVVI
jgi:hypothetical protein